MEKYYIVHYPSRFGMGSNTDTRLVTDKNLRQIIRAEIERKNNGDRFDDRFTGTWNKEKYCESEKIEDIIEDIIQKRLTTCSTYANVNDLIELPQDIPIEIMEEKMEKKIFRIYNQWDFPMDIIVGKGNFIRYRIDLTKNTKNVGLENGFCYEFVEYQLENVAAIYTPKTYMTVISNAKRTIQRMKRKLKGLPPIHEGQYIDDIIPEIGTKEWYERRIEEESAIIEKFKDMKTVADEYGTYLYENKTNHEWLEEQEEMTKEPEDYTKLVYQYPFLCDTLGVQVGKKKQECEYLSYEELFKEGCHLNYLMADLSSRSDSMEQFEEMDMDMVLGNIFAVD